MSKFRGHGAKRSAPERPVSHKSPSSGRAGKDAPQGWRRYMPGRSVFGTVAALAIFVAGAAIGIAIGERREAPRAPARTSLPEPDRAADYEVPVRAYRAPESAAGLYDEALVAEPPVDAAAVPASPVQPVPPEVADPAPAPAAAVPPAEQLAALPSGRQPWERNAAAVDIVAGRPLIAIVVDDLGLDQAHTRGAIDLPAPLTLAFIPYGNRLRDHAKRARERGHELLVHLPMEPSDAESNPGQNALLTQLDPAELTRRIEWNLTQFDGYVGLNNHMGSRFTAWEPGMRMVLQAVQARGLLFLDSRTSPQSVGAPLARSMGLPHAGRDVFLDNVRTPAAIEAQLAELERVAVKHGQAIGICHPHEETLAALDRWIRTVGQRGFQLVPVSAIVRRRLAGAG